MPRAARMVELQNELGQRVRFVSQTRAAAMVTAGLAAEIGSSLRLVRQYEGASVARSSPAGITLRQLERAADVGFERRGEQRGNYEARRIAVWPLIGDDRAILAGGRA